MPDGYLEYSRLVANVVADSRYSFAVAVVALAHFRFAAVGVVVVVVAPAHFRFVVVGVVVVPAHFRFAVVAVAQLVWFAVREWWLPYCSNCPRFHNAIAGCSSDVGLVVQAYYFPRHDYLLDLDALAGFVCFAGCE